jgi:uncharacterized protein YlxP (DUF503 family)
VLVAVERFDLRIPGVHSLKQKRHVLKTLTAALRQSFAVSVAEVEYQDLWQRAAIAVAIVGGEEYHLRRVLREIENRIDAWGEIEVIDRELQVWATED